MNWLFDVAAEYRAELRQGDFFKAVQETKSPLEMRGWVRQLYHQSREFTSALALRYGVCRDPMFADIFAIHAQEEGDHPAGLLRWMKDHRFLQEGEAPESIRPNLETMAVSAYCFRLALREPAAHQVLAMNLVSEGVAYDFYCAVIPKLKELGIHTGNYWTIHTAADLGHLKMGLNLIPEVSPESPEGRTYARIIYETVYLYEQMLDSWARLAPLGK